LTVWGKEKKKTNSAPVTSESPRGCRKKKEGGVFVPLFPPAGTAPPETISIWTRKKREKKKGGWAGHAIRPQREKTRGVPIFTSIRDGGGVGGVPIRKSLPGLFEAGGKGRRRYFHWRKKKVRKNC